MSDVSGKERCPASVNITVNNISLSAEQRLTHDANGTAGTYYHYFTELAHSGGESIIYNFGDDLSKLQEALGLMCQSAVCEDTAQLPYRGGGRGNGAAGRRQT